MLQQYGNLPQTIIKITTSVSLIEPGRGGGREERKEKKRKTKKTNKKTAREHTS